MTRPRHAKRAPRPAASEVRRLDRLEQVRLLAHPLRLRLLEAFAVAPCTTKQAAERLGEPPTRLYHHVNAMERAGLLRLRETRPNRGTIEKYYEPVSRWFEVDPTLMARARGGGLAPAADAMAVRVADDLRQDLEIGLPLARGLPEDLKPLVVRAVIHVDAERICELRTAILALLKRLQSGARRKAPKGEKLRYGLTMALLPTVSPSAAGTAPARRKGSRS